MLQTNLVRILSIISMSLISHSVFGAGWPDPEKFREDINRFLVQDRDQPLAKGAIIGTGSSSMKYWNSADRFSADLSPLTVRNRGFGGSVMHDVEFYLEELVIKHEPRAVILYEGDNDVADEIPLEEIIASFDRIQARLDELPNPPRLYVLSIKPSPLRWSVWPAMQEVNKVLKSRAESNENITFIDVATPMLNEDGTPREGIFVDDGLHMNAKGYDIWRATVRPILIKNELDFEFPKTEVRPESTD